MEHTILLFGFDSLPEILTAQAAAGPFGTEVRAVGPRDCGRTIGALAAGNTAPECASPVALNGRMAVLCGLEEQMNDLLPALRGAGVTCLKAVLTTHNRNWTPERLLTELNREHQAIERKGR